MRRAGSLSDQVLVLNALVQSCGTYEAWAALRISEITSVPLKHLWPGRYPELEALQTKNPAGKPSKEDRMTPHNQLVAEILLVADKAEFAGQQLRANRDAGVVIPFGTAEDHRTEVLCELLDAIDRVHPGLGTRLQNAMHPLTTEESVEEGAPA